jgi:hypothetical protein
LPPGGWLAVQHHLYIDYRWVGIVVEPLATLSTVGLTVAVWDLGVRWVVGVAAVLQIAGQVVYFAVTEPVNRQYATWTADTLPDDWRRHRDRWELSHVVRAALFLGAFGLLDIGVVYR